MNTNVVPQGFGSPPDWAVRCDITLTEPPRPVEKVPLFKASKPEPSTPLQSNVRISRQVAVTTDAHQALARRIETALLAFPGAKVTDNPPCSFPDGEAAPQVTLEFEPVPGTRAVQRHVLRIHDGVETYIVASTAEIFAKKLPELIGAAMLSTSFN